MPHLDAKALETDPEGMKLLRAAIAPRPVPLALLQGQTARPCATARRTVIDVLHSARLHAGPRSARLQIEPVG